MIMQNQTIGTLKKAGFNVDTGTIRLVAILCMIVDHVGVIFFPYTIWLRIIGRIAFPLFCYGIVVGSIATHDRKQYALRLLCCALLSQIPYMAALGHTWKELNVIFTLLLGLLAIVGVQQKWHGSEVWGPVLCLLSSAAIQMDYGWRGVLFILLMYFAIETRGGLAATVIAFCLFWGVQSMDISYLFGLSSGTPGTSYSRMLGPVFALLRLQTCALLALPFILIPTEGNIKINKRWFYAAYPGHLIILYLIRLFTKT